MEQAEQKVSFRQRWDEAQATKKVVFWAILGAIVLTMIVGFGWGGWVTGGTAQAMGETMADDAVVQRLTGGRGPLRVLITRLSHIGDCILTLPILNALRAGFQDALNALAATRSAG